MSRQQPRARVKAVVRAALEGLNVKAEIVSAWLGAAGERGEAVAPGTLKNYRYGRREMPRPMRALLAKQLRRHANRLRALAKDLDSHSL